MTQRQRIFTFFGAVVAAVAFLGLGTWVELRLFDWIDVASISPSLTSAALFFGVLNLNVLVLSVFVFLVFRSAVRLAVDRKKGVFGSSLQAKLVTAFLFFALLPTVILLYMTSKFVNANFEKLMPADVVAVTGQSRESEAAYQKLILELLDGVNTSTQPDQEASSRFVYSPETEEFRFLGKWKEESQQDVRSGLPEALQEASGAGGSWSGEPRWLSLNGDRMVVARGLDGGWIEGLLGPKTIHPHWQLLNEQYARAGPGVTVLKVSYYVMLVVLTLLIVFSATWLGFTIAREFLGPVQVLALATESVAQGDYSVEIDDIISDDEMGLLAQSFRSMVHDLRDGHQSAKKASEELRRKADELFEKSEYNAFLSEHANSGIVVVSAGNLITSWNEKASAVFGLSGQQVMGKSCAEVFDRDFYSMVIEPGLRDVRGGFGAQLRRSSGYRGVFDGQEKQLAVKVARLRDGQSKSESIILIEDVTELARAQRTAAWRDVARRVAHEIKNPLTPITLGVQRMQRRFQSRFEGNDLEVFRDSTRIVLDSTESIRKLVDEFIQFARMPQAALSEGNLLVDAQKAVSGFQNTDDSPIPFSALQLGEDGKRVTIGDLEDVGNRHLALYDRDQIARLIGNLVSNGLNACRESGALVEVIVELIPHESACVLHVRDTGPGIPTELKSKIFEPYFSTRRTGTGLGLAIVRQIVAEHRGRISVRDNSPSGTQFVVTLPVLLSSAV